MRYARLGIMQGRLSPPIDDQIQAFPAGVWEEEFALSKAIGLGCLEWIYAYPEHASNPLSTAKGAAAISDLSNSVGIRVNSVVADYFMEKKLFGVPKSELDHALCVLESLIRQCAVARIPLLEIPFVDQSAMRTENDRKDVIDNLFPVFKKNEERGVKISFETSLEPKIFREVIDAFKPVEIFVNYDMGNSAALGYNPREEIELFGSDIVNVHIKDRIRNGDTVPLGEGDTKFPVVFSELKRIGYSGDYILQAARQDLESDYRESSYKKTIESYIEFVSSYL